MRVVLLAHGLPPRERTGVETHVAALAAALGRLDLEVMVFVPRTGRGQGETLPHLAERCEVRPGYRVHWLQLAREPRDPRERFEPPGLAAAFGDFLDRERPAVAHVHHLAELGAGVARELEQRDIPTVFTAHDHWALCHRATLLRPDLERCGTPGRVEACVRCDRASALLNSLPGLGDYHAGALPEQLTQAERERLAEILDGSEEAGDLSNGSTGAAADLILRRELDGRRRALMKGFERVFAPTQLVAEHLVAAGVASERIVHAPYGIEREPLERVPAPVFDAGRPVRFGYVGGLTKHKGVHVLLEAFGRRFAGSELVVFGESNDAPYTARLAAQARAAGARLMGGFDHHRLPEVLAGIDVLCVPSLWDENAPFVIREAFAAGRPVLASAVGALAESVRDGVDGLLLPPGDVEAWRVALDGLAVEPARGRALAAGVLAPPALEDTARELLELYRRLAFERVRQASTQGSGLAHLSELETRHRDVCAEPLDDLRARALYGIDRLRTGLRTAGALEGQPERSPFWPDEVEGELQDRTRDRRRERDWLRATVREGERARTALAAEAEWLRSQVAAREVERECLTGELSEEAGRAQALEHEARWLRELLDQRGTELTWLRQTLAARDEELEWLRGVAADHAAARAYYRGLAGLGPETEQANEETP